MGGLDRQGLHYPREMNDHVDIPNGCWWGPLDGKTAVPYSMGPITLGAKPLSVGESFWPATLNHPYGETVLIGDDAFKGMGYNAQAWVDSSSYFMHGFRNVEFALIDWYPSPLLIQPQTIILKRRHAASSTAAGLHAGCERAQRHPDPCGHGGAMEPGKRESPGRRRARKSAWLPRN